jgi:uncharacterized protein YndB with AHSA1/START domain
MSTKTINRTTIEVDPNLPTVRTTREFDATPDKVYRAFTDPELVAKWLGPRDYPMRIDEWDARTGGHYRYSDRDAEPGAPGFYGSFHELRRDERIVQTFSYDGIPDGVCLETMTFTELPGGRTRLVSLSVLESIEARDGLVSSGMETGVVEGYDQLDELLPTL